ncbi:hypothetical protein L596_027788 [Steinernema carpocapsae]|uniref:Uncharacterized protein n=1 Tax=Steinernema carpocapsae TaxID=34508 RepID=A0A4U5LWH6_STECR|nr:hypothetical protein L596_027788 [Steinernema carpocapsae]
MDDGGLKGAITHSIAFWSRKAKRRGRRGLRGLLPRASSEIRGGGEVIAESNSDGERILTPSADAADNGEDTHVVVRERKRFVDQRLISADVVCLF